MKKYLLTGIFLAVALLISLPLQKTQASVFSVSTIAASSVATSSANIFGNVTSMGGEPSVVPSFSYGTTTSYGSISASVPSTVTSTAYGYFSASLHGLTCGTTYHFVARISASGSMATGADDTFTTAPCTMPSISAPLASPMGDPTQISLSSVVGDLGGATSVAVGFNYGLTTSYGSTATVTPAPTSLGTVTKIITGLTCHTTYHFRSYATNPAGTFHSADVVATTSHCPPIITTVAASSITQTSAVLNGNLTTLGTGLTFVDVGFYRAPSSTFIPAALGPLTAPGSFSKTITGLTCGGTYTFSAGAGGTSSSLYGSTLTFSALPCVTPLVTTLPATSITTTSAVLSGNLTSLSGFPSVATYFDVSTGMPPIATSTGVYNYTRTGLTCGTTYSYKAIASNTGTTPYVGYGSPVTFSTLPCATLATVTTVSSSSATTTSITLNGNLGSLGGVTSATVGFDYVTTTSWGLTGIFSSSSYVTPDMISTGAFSKTVTGLTCGTSYFFRALAMNTAGTSHGGSTSFSTLACSSGLPAATVVSGSAYGDDGAILVGNLSSMGTGATSATVGFNYGTSTSYGHSTTAIPMTSAHIFSSIPTGLTCHTLYHFRVYATNFVGTFTTPDSTFTSPDCGPVVQTLPSTVDTTTGTVIFHGNLVSLGTSGPALVKFEYGTTTTYGSFSGAPLTLTAPGPFSVPMPLTCSSAYDYRAWGGNAVGDLHLATGVNVHVSTPSCPSVSTGPASIVSPTSEFLLGNLTSTGGMTTVGVGFQYGLTTSYGTSTPLVFVSSLGGYNATITGLACNTLYHYRAVTSSVGVTYGTDGTFTTDDCPLGVVAPTVSTAAATAITQTTATIHGIVSATGGATVTNTQFAGTFGTPISTTTSITTVPSSFSVILSALTCHTSYTFTASATNSAGTGTGTPLTFTTADCTTTGGTGTGVLPVLVSPLDVAVIFATAQSGTGEGSCFFRTRGGETTGTMINGSSTCSVSASTPLGQNLASYFARMFPKTIKTAPREETPPAEVPAEVVLPEPAPTVEERASEPQNDVAAPIVEERASVE